MRPGVLLVACCLVVAAAAASSRTLAAAPSQDPIIGFLNDVVRWDRQQSGAAALAGDPADVVFADGTRRQAAQALQLAFTFARAVAALRPASASPGPGAGGAADGGAGALLGRADQADAAVAAAQGRVDALQRQLEAAPRRSAALVRQQLAEARGEVQLATARRDTLRGLADFIRRAGLGSGGAGLLGQIDELERSVPEAASPSPAPAGAPPPAAVARPTPGGIMALAEDLVGLGRKLHQLHQAETLTGTLRDELDRVRAPMSAQLRDTLERADTLSQAPSAADAATLQQRTQSLDQVTARFKALAAALVPAGKLGVLLEAQRAVLSEWRAAVDLQWDAALRALLLHLAIVAAAIGAVLVASAFWRRATLRYVHDLRRRQQSLLLRRIVVAIAVGLVVIVSLVTEVGSLATYAGFLTAGLAVALQNVILSVVGYFFLIGKYGIRVGDRVQITGVTGDVMDIGLIRLHLMEIGPDGLATGRVVVFSNSVLFQPTASFYKQIPGSDYAWHQVTLTLSPDTDFRSAEGRLLEAVQTVYGRYRDRIARQHRAMSENLSVPVRQPEPQSQLRLTQAGLEMTIRFPVPLEATPSVDDEVTRALVEAVERSPRLKLVGSATPTIQGVPEPAGAG